MCVGEGSKLNIGRKVIVIRICGDGSVEYVAKTQNVRENICIIVNKNKLKRRLSLI